MIYCKELDKEFDNRKEMFTALRKSRKDIVDVKRAKIQKSFEKGVGVSAKSIDISKLGLTTKGIIKEEDYYYIAVNTTKVLDSHGDLHVDGIWNKTANEQQGKNYLVMDHKMEMTNVVVKKENVEMFVAEIPFSSIGKSYEGNTQALIYKVHKDNVINPMAKEWLESGDDIEASVRMQYVKIDLAMNSNDKDDENELKNYTDNIDLIANKSDFEEIPSFWIVSEAKNIGESSLVLRGSNGATGLLDNKNIQPSKDTDKQEPSKDTQTDTNNTKLKGHKLNKFI